jgi:hypothetical protein
MAAFGKPVDPDCPKIKNIKKLARIYSPRAMADMMELKCVTLNPTHSADDHTTVIDCHALQTFIHGCIRLPRSCLQNVYPLYITIEWRNKKTMFFSMVLI